MSSDLARPVWIATTRFVIQALLFGLQVSEQMHYSEISLFKKESHANGDFKYHFNVAFK